MAILGAASSGLALALTTLGRVLPRSAFLERRKFWKAASNLGVEAFATWDHYKGASAGVTTTGHLDFIGETISGVSDRFRERTVAKADDPR